jgi:hypothetical protein
MSSEEVVVVYLKLLSRNSSSVGEEKYRTPVVHHSVILLIEPHIIDIISHIQGYSKKKYTLSKIYFTKTTDAKSIFCV